MFRKLRVRRVLVVGLLVLLTNSPASADTADSNIQEGLSQYQEGLFLEAEKSFSQASSIRPDDLRLNYNLGSSYYKQEKFQEALQDYTHAAMENSDPQLKKNSLYNSGNTLFKMGKLKEAEAAYKKVLILDPSDMDAKFNLEFVRKQIKRKEEEKKESDKKDSSDSEKEEPPENDSQNKEEDQESKSEKPETGEKQPQENDNQNESAQAKELSQEEAEQLLGNLSEDLKNISRMQAGKAKTTESYQGSNW
jgi:Ca-activated chloride channel homolog